MPAKVLIPTPLRQYTARQDTVEVEGRTVSEVLANLTASYGDLRKHLYTDDGRLRSFVNVYVNDEDIRYLQKENTAVKDSDVVSDRKSTRLNSSHIQKSRMPSSA